MRVKLEDVCERGTSSLMQKDIVDKNGKYPVIRCIRSYWKHENLSSRNIKLLLL